MQLKVEHKAIDKAKAKGARPCARGTRHQSQTFIPESTNIVCISMYDEDEQPLKETRLLGGKDLVDFLLRTKFRHCRSCGGIYPEINFQVGDKIFWFTMFKITEKEETIIETDYAKFHRFLHRGKIKQARS